MNDKEKNVYGFLIHITHYDSEWYARKATEKPFSLDTALKIVNMLGEEGFNALIIDCEDGIVYDSHPELKRHYSSPKSVAAELAAAARARGMEIIPKLNFSQTRFDRHNHWMYPHDENVKGVDIFDSERYFEIAFELIDEVRDLLKPERLFHIGMDEDTDRAPSLFQKAIVTLRDGLKKRNLRTLIWRDTRVDNRGLVFTEKHDLVEDALPRDIVVMPWGYGNMHSPERILRLHEKGFEVWGAPGEIPENILRWKNMLSGFGRYGLVLTQWIPCVEENFPIFERTIRSSGEYYIGRRDKR